MKEQFFLENYGTSQFLLDADKVINKYIAIYSPLKLTFELHRVFCYRALFGYDGLSNDLKYINKGDGGLTELIDDFNSGKIQYAFLKVDVPTGSISKYVLINWQVS